MSDELLKLQKKLRDVKKEVAAASTTGPSQAHYVEGLKKGLEIALQEVKLCIDISKARAKLEQLESAVNNVEIHVPQFDDSIKETTNTGSMNQRLGETEGHSSTASD